MLVKIGEVVMEDSVAAISILFYTWTNWETLKKNST